MYFSNRKPYFHIFGKFPQTKLFTKDVITFYFLFPLTARACFVLLVWSLHATCEDLQVLYEIRTFIFVVNYELSLSLLFCRGYNITIIMLITSQSE